MVINNYNCSQDANEPDTNLQSDFLKKAYVEWAALSESYEQCGDNTEDLKGKLVSVVLWLGLSLSQLLRKNVVNLKDKLDEPDELLATFLSGLNYSKDKKKLLNQKLNIFIEYHDTCKHFNRVDCSKQIKKIDSLSYNLVKDFMQTILDIWIAVLVHYRIERIEVGNIKDILGETF